MHLQHTKLRDSWHQHMPQSTEIFRRVQASLPFSYTTCSQRLGHCTTAYSGQNRAPGPPLLGDRHLPPSAQSHREHSEVNGDKKEEKPATPSSKNGFKNQWNSQEVITTFKPLMHSLRNNVSKTAKQMQFFVFKLCKQ